MRFLRVSKKIIDFFVPWWKLPISLEILLDELTFPFRVHRVLFINEITDTGNLIKLPMKAFTQIWGAGNKKSLLLLIQKLESSS